MSCKKVFINCPYDKEYKNFFECIVFLCCYFGFEPCFASEYTDTTSRLDKIVQMIKDSKYGIHDISRTTLSKEKLPRFNMPFELGMDYIYKKYIKAKRKILVIGGKERDYEKCLSDLKSTDIEAHNFKMKTLIKIIRNFLITISKQSKTSSAGEIEKIFKLEFKYWIEDNTKEKIRNMDMSEFKRETMRYFNLKQKV